MMKYSKKEMAMPRVYSCHWFWFEYLSMKTAEILCETFVEKLMPVLRRKRGLV